MKQALVPLILLTLTAATNVAQKPVPSKAVERSRKAANVLESAMAKPDARIPKALLSKAVAVAVITDMKIVGFLIESGGQGYGVVTRRLPQRKNGAVPHTFIWPLSPSDVRNYTLARST